MTNDQMISASEIGLYTFCPQAFEYQQEGIPSKNTAAMRAGEAYHENIGNEMRKMNWSRRILLTLVIMIAVFLIYFLFRETI